MQLSDKVYVILSRFLLLYYTRAENLASEDSDMSEHFQNSGVRIRCPARNFFIQEAQPAGAMRSDRSLKPAPAQFTVSTKSPNAFLNHVLAVNSRIYQCKTPILRKSSRHFFSRQKRELHLGPPRSLHTELNVILDCVTTRHILPPKNGKKGVVILESTGPQLWDFAKIVTEDTCQMEISDPSSSIPIVRELKFKVQGAANVEKRDPANHEITFRYGGGRGRGRGRRRGLGPKTTTTPKPVPIDKDVEYPEAFKSHLSNWDRKRGDMTRAPARPRIVQQSERLVQVEWKPPLKVMPIEFYRVEYMKDDSQNQWLPCHKGDLPARTRAFQFDQLMTFRRYKFRILVHYENGQERYSSPTTWFHLEDWT
nr:PREDICTED: uncharacterized protein LOC109043472 [Bemisia tabaci]